MFLELSAGRSRERARTWAHYVSTAEFRSPFFARPHIFGIRRWSNIFQVKKEIEHMKRLPLVWRSENTEYRNEKILKLGKVECSRIYCMRCLTPHLGSSPHGKAGSAAKNVRKNATQRDWIRSGPSDAARRRTGRTKSPIHGHVIPQSPSGCSTTGSVR